MAHKLKKIKADATQLCAEISSDLHRSSAALDRVATPPFKNLDDFNSWFNSDAPLTL